MGANKWTFSTNSPEKKITEKDKIELVNCPRGGLSCKDNLAEINRLFADSISYQQNKEYQYSIQLLRQAFDETFELQASTCFPCADVFRTEIIGSLQNMHLEIKGTSRGFLKNADRYKVSKELILKTLEELTEKQAEAEKEKDNYSTQKRKLGT